MFDEDKVLAELAVLQEQFEDLQESMSKISQPVTGAAIKIVKKNIDGLRQLADKSSSINEAVRLIRIADKLHTKLKLKKTIPSPGDKKCDTAYMRSIDRL